MSSPNASSFPVGKRHRRKQTKAVLMIGLVVGLGAVLYSGGLPTYVGTIAVADAERMYLLGTSKPSSTSARLSFLTAGSTDGVEWTEPIERTGGVVIGACAADGWLYCLLMTAKNRTQLNVYGGQRWEVVKIPFPWTALSVGHAHERLWVFGLMPPGPRTEEGGKSGSGKTPVKPGESEKSETGRMTLYSACRQDDAWVEGPTLDVSGGEPVNFHLITETGGTHLYWQLIRSDRSGLSDKLYRARFDGQLFGPVESFELGVPQVCVLTSEPDRTLVFAREITTSWWRASDHSIHHFIIRDGAIERAPDIRIDSFRSASIVEDDFTATRFAGKTWFMVCGRYYGLFLAGMDCFELADSRAVAGHRVFSPTADQIGMMAFWAVVTVMALSLLAGSAAGLLRSMSETDGSSEVPPVPYATVLERAVATGLDLLPVGLICWLLLRVLMRSPTEAAVAAGVAFLLYATILESSDGRTLGKRIIGLRVLSVEQRTPNVLESFVRNVLKPVELLTVGVAMILGTRRYQRLGDMVARTVVVSGVTPVASDVVPVHRPEQLADEPEG